MRFFDLPLRAFCDGGFAGLVFVACRTADAPELQRGFIENWRDIDNLTDRYLGVIIPASEAMFVENYWFAQTHMKNDRVSGVRCLTDGTRLTNQFSAARSIIRMDARDRLPEGFVPPKIAGTVAQYEDSLTDAAKDTLEYFGVSESLMPCAVIVSLLEKRASVIELGSSGNVYRVLKSVMTRLEHTFAHCTTLDSALLAAQRERAELRANPHWAVKEHRVAAATAEWQAIKSKLAADLDTAADALAPSSAQLCQWMSARLCRDEPLHPNDWDKVHALRRALSDAGTFGRLPKRLIRTIAKLNAGYPGTHDAVLRRDASLQRVAELQVRVGELKAALTDHANRLRMSEAIEATATKYKLVASDSRGLLQHRRLRWPVTSFVADDSIGIDLERGFA